MKKPYTIKSITLVKRRDNSIYPWYGHVTSNDKEPHNIIRFGPFAGKTVAHMTPEMHMQYNDKYESGYFCPDEHNTTQPPLAQWKCLEAFVASKGYVENVWVNVLLENAQTKTQINFGVGERRIFAPYKQIELKKLENLLLAKVKTELLALGFSPKRIARVKVQRHYNY